MKSAIFAASRLSPSTLTHFWIPMPRRSSTLFFRLWKRCLCYSASPITPSFSTTIWGMLFRRLLFYIRKSVTQLMCIDLSFLADCGWIFIQHFCNRLCPAYLQLRNVLDESNSAHAEVLIDIKRRFREETFTRESIRQVIHAHPELGKLCIEVSKMTRRLIPVRQQ